MSEKKARKRLDDIQRKMKVLYIYTYVLCYTDECTNILLVVLYKMLRTTFSEFHKRFGKCI